MVRKKKQMRYVKDGDARNYPADLTRDQLIAGTRWGTDTRIVELTINAMVGFGFYVNDTPTMIRILHPGDPTQNETESRKFTFPANVLQMNPIYNIKIDAASLARLIAWNQSHVGNEIWLFIDYVNEEN